MTRGNEEVGCGSVDEEEVESEGGRVSMRWRLDGRSCRFWVGGWVGLLGEKGKWRGTRVDKRTKRGLKNLD